MKRYLRFALAWTAVIVVGAGCGDNPRQCGDGTTEIDGLCTPTSTIVCGDGTLLSNGQCLVDPASCQAGTVLIANRCVDPTNGLVVDLEESIEPNGLGIALGVEDSAAPAGTIAPKPIGQTFIVHGHLTPFRDSDVDGQFDPDVDTYFVTVTAPALLNVSVDGIGGVEAGFYAYGDPQGAVPTYERYGLSLTGDRSQRRLFLPAAGRYALVIADTRSLSIGNNPPPPAGARGAAGGPNAEYYASITAESIPAPVTLPITRTATGGTASQTGTLATDEVKFFTAALGSGTNDIHEVMAGAPAASVSVLDLDQLKGYADETPGGMSVPPTEARVSVTGIPPGDAPLIVVDAVYNYGPAPEPFTLTISVSP
jgi:hypothetical protein